MSFLSASFFGGVSLFCLPISFFKEREKERAGSWLIAEVRRSGRCWGREKHDHSILYKNFAIKMVYIGCIQ